MTDTAAGARQSRQTRASRDRFRVFHGVVEIPLDVHAEGPLLIKGPAAALPDRPDAAFVRYPAHGGTGPVPYLPGSSLKGVLRSGAEALLRALGQPVCDVFETRTKCSDQIKVTSGPWADRCPACLAFGSVEGASVLLVEDGLPWETGASPEEREKRAKAVEASKTIRANVAIDRQTGTAGDARLFDYEALVGATFYPVLRLRNPEPWQAGLVAAAIGLLDDGTLRLGSYTTKGLGRVRATPAKIVVRAMDTSGRIRELVDAGGFAAPTSAGLLQKCKAEDPSATLLRWSESLRDWLQTASRPTAGGAASGGAGGGGPR